MKININKILRNLLLILITGFFYYRLEILYRGYSSYWMILVGGACVYLAMKIHSKPEFYDKKMWQQCIISSFTTLCIEFISGVILNICLGLHIWDYSNELGNILGQVCPVFGLYWFILMPLAMFIGDDVDYELYGGRHPKRLLKYYKDLFTNK